MMGPLSSPSRAAALLIFGEIEVHSSFPWLFLGGLSIIGSTPRSSGLSVGVEGRRKYAVATTEPVRSVRPFSFAISGVAC